MGQLVVVICMIDLADGGVVTGQSLDDDKRRSVDAGADGYFVKPLSLRMLNDLIQLHFPK